MIFWLKQFFSSPKVHRLALWEVLVVCIVSLLPLLALALIDRLPLPETDVEQLFWASISAGQLYLYSFSLFGTLLWLCLKEHDNFARFQPRIFLFFITFIPCVVILLIYARNPSMSKPLAPGFVRLSFAVYGLYAVLYYILLVFDHLEPPPVEKGLQSDSDSLIEKFENRGTENG